LVKEIAMAGKWVYPVDPECPVVADFYESLYNDPMTIAYGAPVDDIGESFERRHRAKCKRCQEYGAANVDVEY
jgi:hypothetical protein